MVQAGLTNAAGLQWIVVNDFSHGVVNPLNQNFSPSASIQLGRAPLGSASPNGTVDCCALSQRQLGPVPWQFSSQFLTNGDSNIVAGSTAVVGMMVSPFPMGWATSTPASQLVRPYQLWLVFDYLKSTDTWRRHNIIQYAAFNNWSPQSFLSVIANNSASANQVPPTPASLTQFRANPTTPNTIGVPCVGIAAAFNDPNTTTQGYWRVFPDPNSPQTVSNFNLSGGGYWNVQHQLRLMLLSSIGSTFNYHGSASYAAQTNDSFAWTNPNSLTIDSNGNTFESDPSWFGAVGSSNSGELLLVKGSGGMLSVTGDLDNPTVTLHGSVQGTDLAFSDGCFTPDGFVYGSWHHSVYAWGGGQVSTDLAPQMWRGFATPPTPNGLPGGTPAWGDRNIGVPWIMPYLGRFCYQQDFLFAPGNWVMDANHAWWPISTPGGNTCYMWDRTPDGNMIGVPFRTGDTGVTIAVGNTLTPAQSYTWVSQAIPISQNDDYSQVAEIVLYASPSQGGNTSSVQVSITSYPDGASFTSSNISLPTIVTPIRIPMPSNIMGTHVSVELDCNGTSIPAPTVWQFALGVQGDRVPVTAS